MPRHPTRKAPPVPRLVLCALAAMAALTLAACGGGTERNKDRTKGSLPSSGEMRRELERATASTAANFPSVKGRTLQQVADSLDGAGTQVGLATSDFVPGRNRLAFGVLGDTNEFVYGKTAVYVADDADERARGPFPAPADLLITDPRFRSQTAATEKDPFSAVYETTVPFSSSGRKAVLVVTKLDDGQLIGAATALDVQPTSADTVVGVGDQAPRVETDTRTSAGGNMKAIDTRLPPDDMHDESFADVVGKKPVALLFATPQLCQSRVCGPVVDIAAQLKATYGDRMTFIHQEVYKDNDLNKGLREPLKRFGLQTEPWLFIVDRTGKVTARLEGSFGFNAFNAAIKTGLGA